MNAAADPDTDDSDKALRCAVVRVRIKDGNRAGLGARLRDSEIERGELEPGCVTRSADVRELLGLLSRETLKGRARGNLGLPSRPGQTDCHHPLRLPPHVRRRTPRLSQRGGPAHPSRWRQASRDTSAGPMTNNAAT